MIIPVYNCGEHQKMCYFQTQCFVKYFFFGGGGGERREAGEGLKEGIPLLKLCFCM